MSIKKTVSACILAFSRFELLKKLINALRSQTIKPDQIIVVNQGNSQQISDWLGSQKDLLVITQENKGSAGGFSRCIRESVSRGYDWTWIFDDDAIPELDSLEKLINCPYYSDNTGISFLSSMIIDKNGKTYMSPEPTNHNSWYGSVLSDGCVEVSSACWLGMLISSNAVKSYGLPIEEFYLWDEDLEYSSRLSRNQRAYCILSSKIVHYQEKAFDPFRPGDQYKFLYWVRNRIARRKIEPGNIFKKGKHVLSEIIKFSIMIIKREAPIRTVISIFNGVFLFWPKIQDYREEKESLELK